VAPPDVTVRPVAPSDRDAWVEMRAQLWPDHSPEELAREVDSYLSGGALWKYGSLSIPFHALVAEDPAHRLVGFLEVSLRPFADKCRTGPVGYLEGWFVVPARRRQGVGRALVTAGEAWASARGCVEMASDARVGNTVSADSHGALGYQEVERLIHFRRGLPRR